MSIDAIDMTEQQATDVSAEAPSRRPRRRTIGSRPGLSALAQGEPMLWLTGGSLTICVAMIVGLLLWVLCAGMATFWPTRLVQIQLRDGTVYLGEVSRHNKYSLSRDAIGGLPEPIAEEAKRRLGDEPEVEASRRLLRTGNFELTNTHFHWISDFEIEPATERMPEWSMVVEREEWGRFYGAPVSFTRRLYRELGDEEQTFLEMVQFFESNQWRLSDQEELSQLENALAPLIQRYEPIRNKAVSTFLESQKPGDGYQLEAVLENGERVPLAEATAEQNVVQIAQVWTSPEDAWDAFCQWHRSTRNRRQERVSLEKHQRGRIDGRDERERLRVRRAELDHQVAALSTANEMVQVQHELQALQQTQEKTEDLVQQIADTFPANSQLCVLADRFGTLLTEENREQRQGPEARMSELLGRLADSPPEVREAVQEYLDVVMESAAETELIVAEIDQLKHENTCYQLQMITAQGQEKSLQISEIVRAYPANQLTTADRVGVYLSRWWEFLTADPREANSEGGVFPAIWGTIVMTLIMSLVVVPFGVLAALYLREYAKAGPIVSAVRISINNLAGVPSIVFGVFGMGFFCYVVGAYIDGGPENANLPVWPSSAWTMTMLILAGSGFLAFVLSMYSMRGHAGGGGHGRRLAGYIGIAAWLGTVSLVVVVLTTTPYFGGWFETSLPNPKFGKGGLLWASLTLALLTLPVVIVATEEALSAVPNSLREGSYACGAGKWQTIRRIVLPHAAPGIMTGMILAMARGAGEVAPLMFVGAVKLAPELPVDGTFPFVHADRSFMHLGFHIFDLGFQSQNSEAAKPMVYTTTLLLILIIALLNFAAVWMRSRLRRRFAPSAF